MAITSIKGQMLVKPGDLIKRIRDPYSSRTPTTFYVEVTDHPASSGIVEGRGDRRVQVDQGIVYPALVISTYTHIDPEGHGLFNKHLYAFVVWPTVGMGWVWIGECLESENHLGKCDRWEFVGL